jgi:hypothetical protein
MTPHQRGRLGGLARSAMYDGREMTAKARQAARDRFLEQVDPTGDLRRKDPAEAGRRAEAARKLFYTRLAYQSAATRARKKRSPGD